MYRHVCICVSSTWNSKNLFQHAWPSVLVRFFGSRCPWNTLSNTQLLWETGPFFGPWEDVGVYPLGAQVADLPMHFYDLYALPIALLLLCRWGSCDCALLLKKTAELTELTSKSGEGEVQICHTIIIYNMQYNMAQHKIRYDHMMECLVHRWDTIQCKVARYFTVCWCML